MSNAVSALNHASYQGFALVEEMGLQGMITLRGDFADATFQKAVKDVCGQDIPGQREVTVADGKGVAWMSPDELLVLVPYSDSASAAMDLAEALKGTHALAANVSDARVVIRVKGENAREVIAKIAPVDLSVASFQPGQIRRTRLAQVAAAFWMSGEDEFTIVAFRSVADYVFNLLKTSAIKGSEVGYL
ncbi:sarcosine oxidase subunit gamma [Cochlodiniinecator piscidefendens]|uniref:sarcosine oxidase subunit gamma n=1 Tax=Cochlodiniinecator piscidefendens TaxID=2715756 RepID=UPI00140CA4EC|nr:sarcosine oxidase subunit gamma family protein [Cochlodiniinecator piscidefendens]